MKFVNYIIERFEFNSNNDETKSMSKFKSNFGSDAFNVKGIKFKFTNHAAHRYIERFNNDSKLYLLDQLKKIANELRDKENKLYFFKIKGIDKGFVVDRITDRTATIVTVYGDEMINKRKTTETIILESICEIIEI